MTDKENRAAQTAKPARPAGAKRPAKAAGSKQATGSAATKRPAKASRPGGAGRRTNQGKKRRRRARQRGVLILVGLILVALLLLAALLLHLRNARSGAPKDAAESALAAATAPVIEETATPTPEPTPTPTPDPTPDPMPTLEPVPTVEPTPTPEPPRVKIDYPYAIVVDRGAQVVTILTVGETGDYDVVARQMICSTDKYNRKPTNGVYALDGEHKRWLTTLLGSYAQYATRISGTILFHSIPYNKKREDRMMTEEYGKLGQNVSEGCVRLTCEDAKWIYENIPKGTLVRFVEGEYDAAQLEALAPPALGQSGWDPTDASADNPDYIGGSYHDAPVATPWPYMTPNPTKYPISVWKRPK